MHTNRNTFQSIRVTAAPANIVLHNLGLNLLPMRRCSVMVLFRIVTINLSVTLVLPSLLSLAEFSGIIREWEGERLFLSPEMPLAQGQDLETAQKILGDFIQNLETILPKYVPS
jgi:hypothetical protein